MWKNYSVQYFKRNKGLLFFLAAVAFFASLLLSLIGSFFYNLWSDYIYRSYLETGIKAVDVTTAAKIYTAIMVLAVISLTFMIYNTFGISMNARIHHLGILKSVGATPRQLNAVLVQETLGVCLLPVFLGTATGTLVCRGIVGIIIELGRNVRTYEVEFRFSPYIFFISFAASMLTIGISAWIPARKISRISVLDAIINREEQPFRIKKFRIFSLLFGVEGELARRSMFARRRSLRISRASLFFAIMALFTFLNIERISALSVKETYWDRYEDVWDYMITAEENTEKEHALLKRIRETEGVESCILYQKSQMQLQAGEESIAASLFIMDNESFMEYRKECGLKKGAVTGQGAVVVNLLWDRENSSRTDRKFVPVLEGETVGGGITVVGLTDRFPPLREELGIDSLTVVMDEAYFSSLQKLHSQNPFPTGESFFTVIIEEAVKKDAAKSAETDNKLKDLAGGNVTLESREEKQASDERIRKGLRFIAAVVAAVLALTGLSNVFSVTLGQIRQRKREFARYLSVGMSFKGLKKVLWVEAFKISVVPLLLSLLINCPIVWLALNSSGVAPMEFLKNMPLGPILIFSFGIVFLVYLAYYIGEKQILREGLIDILKDDRICE